MSKEPRTAQTNIRSYHRERREWIEAAERDGLELGSWARYHLNRAARGAAFAECEFDGCKRRIATTRCPDGVLRCPEHIVRYLANLSPSSEDGI